MSLTMAICVHKAPEGLALGALLLGAGYHRGRMLWLVAAVESTTILGGVLGWFVFRNVSNLWLDLALAHAGGGFHLPGRARGAGRDHETREEDCRPQFYGGLLRHRVVDFDFPPAAD
jgi:hypothetical protein